MAYKTYITEALVCGSENRNTADRSLLLFTRDAGMLYASVKSIRKEESKHRYALQECSHAKITLVRGKAGWRIAGAEAIRNLYANAKTRETRLFLRNIILLLRRVVHGEVSHPEIFDDLIEASAFVNEHNHKAFEQVCTLRMLYVLGYVPPSPEYEHLLGDRFPKEAVEELPADVQGVCEKASERALIESQL